MGSPAAPAPPSTEATKATTRVWLVPLLVLVTGMFMSLLDTSIINVALPTMATDFGVTNDDIEWVATAYTLALGVIVPLTGWLGDRFGLARVYIASMLLFAVVSALCGLAWDLGSEIVFRVLQAVPGGVLPVATLTLVYQIVPREKIGAAMGIYGIGVAFAPATGPTLGGYLVEYVDWRLIFYINVPIGVLGSVAAFFLLPRVGDPVRKPFDWWGFLFAAYGLFALLLAFSKGQKWHWGSYPILILLVSSVLSLALFVVIELEVEHPLLELRVFRHPLFVNSLFLVCVLVVGLFTLLFYMPLFLQDVRGIRPFHSGLILLPEALVISVLLPIGGLLYDRIGPRWPAVIGLAIAAYGTWLLAGITPRTTESTIILWTCVRAVGNGLAMMPIFTAGLDTIPAEHASSGSALNNIGQRVTQALGLAALTAMVSSQQHQLLVNRGALMTAADTPPQVSAAGPTQMYGMYQQLQGMVTTTAYSNAFQVTAVITLLGVGLAALMRKPPTRPPITSESQPVQDRPSAEGEQRRAPEPVLHV